MILFTLNATMMSLGRLPLFSFIPGMFFGFASYFATYFGGFGPVPRDPVAALGAVMLMNALGPAYAWLTARYGAHHHHAEEAHAENANRQARDGAGKRELTFGGSRGACSVGMIAK